MFFKQKSAGNRRVSPTASHALSPRFERLLRESRWLLVVALLGYVALVLGSYTKTDPGWSFSGSGAPIANRGGHVGAWLSDLLLYLFGLSAWWLVVAGIVIIALPMFGDYYTPNLLSGSPQTTMIGNQIDLYISGGQQKPVGAALVCVLMALLLLLMLYYLIVTARATRRYGGA